MNDWDVFISHASEDKATVARPLAERLRARGRRVWLDESELTLGDSLTAKIDEGLARSKYGIVILSPAFFGKSWPRKELDGLVSREALSGKVVLPVWHGVSHETVNQFSPTLAGRLAANTESGLDAVAAQIERVLSAEPGVEAIAQPRGTPGPGAVMPHTAQVQSAAPGVETIPQPKGHLVQQVRPARKRWPFLLVATVLGIAAVSFGGYAVMSSPYFTSVSDTSWEGIVQGVNDHIVQNMIVSFHSSGKAEFEFFTTDRNRTDEIRTGPDNLCTWQQNDARVMVSCPHDQPHPKQTADLLLTKRFFPELAGTFSEDCEGATCPPNGLYTRSLRLRQIGFTGHLTYETSGGIR